MGRRGGSLPKFSPEQRRAVMRLAATGLSSRQIAARVVMSSATVLRVLRPLGGVVRRDMLEGTGRRLSLQERVEIRVGVERGLSGRAIAAGLGRDAATVCRELRSGGGRDRYEPVRAHAEAQRRARRPKATKLAAHPDLCAQVVAGLQQWWSPQQIARRLAAEFGDDKGMRVSHETIYKSLYVQGRGELRRELTRCLRSGRASRRARGRQDGRGKIPDMVMISERPADVEDRAVPGHWEGDLIVGKNGASAIGTLVERTTRFVMLLHLADQRAETVRDAITAKIATLPQALARSLTWDQGSEMAQHVRFRVETGIPVYFCDPHAPWQRGSNENTNGLLRQYFPKGTDLSVHSPEDLDTAADSLNGRPRQTLQWMTPSEQLEQLLVASTG
jgi:IS30 family transposase